MTGTTQQQHRLRGDERIHLVGLGGIGMSAIAYVLLGRGHPVSGSDLHDSPLLDALAGRGAQVYVGHAAEQVHGSDLVVATSAAPDDNAEIVEAHRLGLPVWRRGQMLSQLTASRRCLAVAGTHGKTTTTAMLTLLLRAAGLDPSFIIGGEVDGLPGHGHAGSGPHFVIEADEYDRTFLSLRPAVAVVTNVEWDHVDCYPDLPAVQAAFREFIARVPPTGAILLCQDDPGAWQLPRPAAPVLGYGLAPQAHWGATGLTLGIEETAFTALRDGLPQGRFRLRVPGEHNVRNALAALAAASWEGVEIGRVAEALAGFSGVRRRFQPIETAREVTVVDDYAHHPSEIRATLAATRQRFPGRRLVAAFQPHTYSRTRALAAEFAESLSAADLVLVLGIYAAREENPGDVSGAQVAAAISPPAAYIETMEQALPWLDGHLRPGDVLLTLGAGDVTALGPRLLAHWRAQDEERAHGHA